MHLVMLELLRHPTLELPCTLEEAELCARSVMTELLRHPTCALGELCVCLVMTEQLWRPTPELTCVLRELMYALGDAGAAVAPHTGAAVHSQGCGADVCAW